MNGAVQASTRDLGNGARLPNVWLVFVPLWSTSAYVGIEVASSRPLPRRCCWPWNLQRRTDNEVPAIAQW